MQGGQSSSAEVFTPAPLCSFLQAQPAFLSALEVSTCPCALVPPPHACTSPWPAGVFQVHCGLCCCGGQEPGRGFPLAPSSKARENWGRGAHQVLPTDLILRPQEPENEGLRWGKVDPPPEPAHRSLGTGSSRHLSTRGWRPVGRTGEPSHPSTELGLSSLTQAVG